jgi:hypothetical protein
MPNQHVVQRLVGIQTILNGVHQANSSMSSASKGQERQGFIDEFLSKVLPPIYRFGSGDATDLAGNRSGQLDVVVEYPFSPTLPIVGAGTNRLYLAEGIAAVIEVKSDISSQWAQAVQTATQLAQIKRTFGGMMTFGGNGPTDEIPLFIASYTGWKTIQTVQTNMATCPNVAGVLIIDQGLFVSSPNYGGIQATGALALWGLICSLHNVTNSLQAAVTNPIQYVI